MEAGVNIDIQNCFNKLYCVLSDGSCSARSFLQMTARVRHLNDNNILILNESFKLNKTTNYWNYEDIEPNIKYISNDILKTQYINNGNDILMKKKIYQFLTSIIFIMKLKN